MMKLFLLLSLSLCLCLYLSSLKIDAFFWLAYSWSKIVDFDTEITDLFSPDMEVFAMQWN
jgi:hypothetical protein